ncbi:PSD1 and planctomycete cytochrome C domain-containing protein [Tautonia plasticadhaerens]|uniref:Planctomycete cytochrome C n=1 Tax=Tautonia plasticadhaerens TaxID=2527974 RepID=A0A518H7Q9_9BACT|nr:PSD1 and planctomycete cytochrome C domain-containing protein [Tautonia plasticadhaerens]QDV36855.1 Planctomycete cytochrome C [Tautonia plasticadhaerens]
MTSIGLIASLGILASAPIQAQEPPAPGPAPAERVTFFEGSVRPILERHCLDCHGGGEKIRGGLDLTSRAGALEGGDFGPAIDEEFPEASLLLEAISYEGLVEMPPSGKLDPAAIDVLTRWVEMGAPYGDDPADATAPAPPAEVDDRARVTEADRAHWAFRPVERPEVPEVEDPDWVLDPIDAFVLDRLEQEGLGPAPDASRATLIRRLSYDLTGLPPTPGEVDAFLSDESPGAYEALVDRLLASPHYGERWGRHWLDVVRFAETNSFERDRDKPSAWRYRDYVIDAFNDDTPYDRFVREQLAGDELDGPTAESIIATGFYRLGAWDDEPTDPLQARFDELDDIVSTTSQAFLGLTINCARCHDHKIDPIPQRDYYRFLAFVSNLEPYSYEPDHILTEIASPGERADHARAVADRRGREQAIDEELAPIEQTLLAAVPEPRRSNLERGSFEQRRHVLDGIAEAELSAVELARYRSLIGRWRAIPPVPPLPTALSAREPGPEAPQSYLLIRGSAHAQGDPVEPGFPEVLGAADPLLPGPSAGASTSGRRRALADWIASPENPMTARVMVNRVWHYHFGRGIVRTPSDFGVQGSAPTHPELLDWLAAEFVADGWRLKPLHKRIVMSRTYRMSSAGDPEALAVDPQNDLFWRFDLRRLSAEEIRDSMLAVTGALNPEMGGPGYYSEIPAAYLAGQSRPGEGWGDSPAGQRARRSVYIHVKRSLVTPILASFDSADTDFSCPVRFATTQPTQALSTLNGEFLNAQARDLADRVRGECGQAPGERVRRVLRLVTQRSPTEGEVARGVTFIDRAAAEDEVGPDRAFELFCLLALNLNEFFYVD